VEFHVPIDAVRPDTHDGQLIGQVVSVPIDAVLGVVAAAVRSARVGRIEAMEPWEVLGLEPPPVADEDE
jgi:hypothetical protein